MTADTGGPRDWDKEMAEIDKLIASGAGDAPAPVGVPAGGRAGVQKPGSAGTPALPHARTPGGSSRRDVIFTWLRLTLGLAVGIGMTQWPYTHGCGLPLAGYLAGVATVIVAAFWSMVSSWKTRSGFAHFLSIALLFWGAALAAREVLPRIGYAKDAAGWQCAAPAVQVNRPQPPAPSPAPQSQAQPSTANPAPVAPAAPNPAPAAPAARDSL